VLQLLLVLLPWLTAGGIQDSNKDAPAARILILVPIGAEASWRDHAFLAAVPAACLLGNDEPMVLAVDAAHPWRPEVLDFLQRYAPTRTIWLGQGPTAPTDGVLPPMEILAADSAMSAAVAIASQTWTEARRVVMYDLEDPAAALTASTLAARLSAPLFPMATGTEASGLQALLASMGTERALVIGKPKPPKWDGMHLQHLENAEEVLVWLRKQELSVHYLAAVNPNPLNQRDRALTLAAPMLAAGHKGMVAPLPFETVWKRRFDADQALKKQPDGAADSNEPLRTGTLELAGKSYPFLLGRDPGDGRRWMQIDRNRNGSFRGKKELPVHTGEAFQIGKTQWIANLDAVEGARGSAVWLTSPTTAEMHEALDGFHRAAGYEAETLCMVGWPEALPMATISHGQGIDADLVSDLPYAQIDDDPFFELALTRFIAEDLPSATLLACRSLARDDFPDRGWEDGFATAEWESTCRSPMEGAGLEFQGHHPGKAPFSSDSPLSEVGLIVHGSHAAWTEMGKTYAWNSDTLFAPALVDSAGCSTASLDQDPERRSVAARLLRNGAVAFVGNTRRGIGEQSLFRSEMWNALLADATLGEAQRQAMNRVLVAVLEKGETVGGKHFYQLYNHAVFGDAGLQLGLARSGAESAAAVRQSGKKITVFAPERWHRTAYTPLEEWGCSFPQLYSWRGAGVGVECTWFNPEKRNQEDLYFHVEATTRSKVDMVKPIGKVADPLGWTGSCFVDHHADGSRTLHWRVRLLDGDMTTGEVRAQVKELEFRLTR
jgi:hypothetical protein